MIDNRSQQVINKTYDLMELDHNSNLASRNSQPKSIVQSRLLESIKQKLDVDSVFFYQPNNGETSIPYILFSRLEDTNQLVGKLAELHRTAWNMARAPLLFIATPDGTVRIFDAYSPPSTPDPNSKTYQSGLIEALNVFNASEAERLHQKYHRREFESGRFWQNNKQRFNIKNRVDQTLLQNLRIMHRTLVASLDRNIENVTASEVIHNLIGRSIFIKYLEDRRDSSGKNVFAADENFFGQFVANAQSFTDVLQDKLGTYQLFEYLKSKFNGDLFPISDEEKTYVQNEQLNELRLFLLGQARLSDRQLGFWKFYSFDVIPIEFISSIYEEFFHITEQERAGRSTIQTGTHYTPHYLVEFLVDEVFPWEGDQIDCKVLDPACGSGIFLVEIYRRLISRWQQKFRKRLIQFADLEKLLVDNIFGVDLDASAIRVAAFSLYLTLCDFLEPRDIWKEVTFPALRNKNLFHSDFFAEDDRYCHKKYDLIVGNPPWQSELTKKSEAYIEKQKAEFKAREFAPDNQIALTFLWRSSELCKPNGEICLLVPSKGLLFNRSQPHLDFRRDFFSSCTVSSVINFSAYRRVLFSKSSGPGAAIHYTPSRPENDQPILYCSPKPAHTVEDTWQFMIEPYDIAQLPLDDACENPLIWKVAMWGGPRDYELIQKLQSPPYQTLDEICESRQPKWIHGEGIIVGNKSKNAQHLIGKPFLELGKNDLDRFVVDENKLPVFDLPKVERPRTTKPEIFQGPHILIKQSPKSGEKSFRAALLPYDAVFRDSLIGIHGSRKDLELLAQCCLVLNSHVPLYYAMMTSRRWLVERDELNKEEVMDFPMPPDLFDSSITYQNLEELAHDPEWEPALRRKVGTLYSLTEEESILIDDAIDYILDYFRSQGNATQPTYDIESDESHLKSYSRVLQNTLANSFGTCFQAIIFRGQSPLRIIGLRETSAEKNFLNIETSPEALEEALDAANGYLLEQRSSNVFVQRHIRAYVGDTIYIIKPDQRRYWTRSIALRDADEIYADIMRK